MNGIAKRLEARFGLGTMPLVRRRLYLRIERICLHDEVATAIVAETATTATGKEKPGNWFAASVTRRLAEAGYSCSEKTAAILAERQRLVQDLAGRFSDGAVS